MWTLLLFLIGIAYKLRCSLKWHSAGFLLTKRLSRHFVSDVWKYKNTNTTENILILCLRVHNEILEKVIQSKKNHFRLCSFSTHKGAFHSNLQRNRILRPLLKPRNIFKNTNNKFISISYNESFFLLICVTTEWNWTECVM